MHINVSQFINTTVELTQNYPSTPAVVCMLQFSTRKYAHQHKVWDVEKVLGRWQFKIRMM